MDKKVPTITILHGDTQTYLEVDEGANLRKMLLQHGISPYAPLARKVNCGGRGICATCGVWVESPTLAPMHWHDKLADGFGYPRLSCQITVDNDMTIRLVDDKWLWGNRNGNRATWFTKPPMP
jgi:ferredoxin